MLVGDEWIEIAPLNIARFCCTSINHKGLIWCIGGINENNIALDTIEIFDNFVWKILDLRLFEPTCVIGALCLENYVLLYGGKNTKKDEINTAYLLDTSANEIQKEETVDLPLSFSQMCLLLTKGRIFHYPSRKGLYELQLKSILS